MVNEIQGIPEKGGFWGKQNRKTIRKYRAIWGLKGID